MTIYRVLIVDDSRFMRRVLSDMVNADETFTVASTASDGEEAIRLAMELKPDIITMDMEMPRMNGLEALRRIMAVRPTPVIMLSAVTDNGTRNTIKALQYGAFDFIRKPDSSVNLDIGEVSKYLLEKLHIAAASLSKGTLRMLPAVEDGGDADDEQAPERVTEKAAAEAEEAQPQAPTAPAPTTASASPEIPPQPATRQIARKNRFSGEELGKPAPSKYLPQAAPVSTKRQAKQAATTPLPGVSPAGERKPSAKQHAPLAERTVPMTAGTADGKPGQKKPAAPPVPPIPSAPASQKKRGSATFSHIVALGTSTGGPRALHEVLTKIPKDFEAPVLIVQHMPPKFTFSLAQRLNSFCSIIVREAVHDEPVESGTAYIAPGGKHMTMVKDAAGGYRIRLSEEGPRSGHMPSVDVLFESLIGLRGLRRHAVLMTGMGSDGAKGMKALQEDGAETRIAESEETCVVYGMPRSAVELGAVTGVLPLQQIGAAIVREVRSRHA